MRVFWNRTSRDLNSLIYELIRINSWPNTLRSCFLQWLNQFENHWKRLIFNRNRKQIQFTQGNRCKLPSSEDFCITTSISCSSDWYENACQWTSLAQDLHDSGRHERAIHTNPLPGPSPFFLFFCSFLPRPQNPKKNWELKTTWIWAT